MDKIDIKIGHDEIKTFMSEQFRIYSWRTVLRWRKSGMPFHRLWNGKPYIIPEEVIRWQLKKQ
ncbi:MAG: hypothetical protein WC451_05810 [Patescibacteria group bacterium]